MSTKEYGECPGCGHVPGPRDVVNLVWRCPDCGRMACASCVSVTGGFIPKYVCPKCKVAYDGYKNLAGSIIGRR